MGWGLSSRSRPISVLLCLFHALKPAAPASWLKGYSKLLVSSKKTEARYCATLYIAAALTCWRPTLSICRWALRHCLIPRKKAPPSRLHPAIPGLFDLTEAARANPPDGQNAVTCRRQKGQFHQNEEVKSENKQYTTIMIKLIALFTIFEDTTVHAPGFTELPTTGGT